MNKTHEEVFRSELEELYDRAKMVVYDIADFANRKNCEVTFHVRPDGTIHMSVFEKTTNRTYVKSITQDSKSIKYQEVVTQN